MSTKSIRRLAILFIGAIMTAFGLFPARLSAQVLHLQPGTTTVASGQATCEHEVLISQAAMGLGSAMESGCTGGVLTMKLKSGAPILPNINGVNVSAFSQLIVQFQVDTQPGAPDVSTLPVLISLPVTWKGTLFNDGVIPPVGPLDPLAAHADVNGKLYLALGQSGAPGNVGTTISAINFMGAAHGGITGCLSVPKGAISGALMIGKCVIDAFKKEQGNGIFYISGEIRTGQTYDVVLELDGDIFTLCAAAAGCIPRDGEPAVNFETEPVTDKADSSFGLTWTDVMTITVGTDFQSRIAGLQNEIVDLQNQLNQLRQEFKTHTHVYLTGKGVGQNNTKVNTGPPNF